MKKLKTQWLGLRDQTQLKRESINSKIVENAAQAEKKINTHTHACARTREKVIYTEDSVRRSNMSLIGVSKGEEREKGAEARILHKW